MAIDQSTSGQAQDASQDASSGAILWILGAMALFSAQDAIIKLVSADVSLWQLQLVRSLGALTLVLLAITLTGGWRRQRLRSGAWPVIRSLFFCGAYLCFYASLPFLPLSVAAAGFFVGPLFITVLARIFLGEPIGPRRVIAVCLGFAGVLVIVKVDGGALSWASLGPLAAAACYALGVIVTRARCLEDSVFALSLVNAVTYVAVGAGGVALMAFWAPDAALAARAPFLFTSWLAAAAAVYLLVLATSCTNFFGGLATTWAYQHGEASRVAPFEYFYLALAPLWDVFVWDDPPEPRVWLGVALIAIAGAFVAWREGRPARPAQIPHGEEPWTPPDHPFDPPTAASSRRD